MRKIYEEPEINIRAYTLPSRNVVMTSDPNVTDPSGGGGGNLDDGDDVTIPRYFGG